MNGVEIFEIYKNLNVNLPVKWVEGRTHCVRDQQHYELKRVETPNKRSQRRERQTRKATELYITWHTRKSAALGKPWQANGSHIGPHS